MNHNGPEISGIFGRTSLKTAITEKKKPTAKNNKKGEVVLTI